MPKPSLAPGLTARGRFAVAAGRLASALARRTGRGGGFQVPGQVALRVAPDLLAQQAAGRTVLLVSGTNGKTTTTRLLAAAVGIAGPVVSNSTGANMRPGLASALLLSRESSSATAVLEVDEPVLATVLVETKATVVVLLNLSRDQLDRSGEVSTHVRRWSAAVATSPDTVVVANADDPLVWSCVATARPDSHNVVWVAVGATWPGDSPLCPVCGAARPAERHPWSCDSCGAHRPETEVEVLPDGTIRLDDETHDASLSLPGMTNRGNAALAVAAARAVGIAPDAALAAMAPVRDVAGRYRVVEHQGRQVRLLLAKNPAGWADVLVQLTQLPGPVVVAVNARSADGRDTSWLWDVDFEQLAGRAVAAAGERSGDVGVRLRYAGVPAVSDDDPLAAVRAVAPDGPVTVAANYTAFAGIYARLRDAVVVDAA